MPAEPASNQGGALSFAEPLVPRGIVAVHVEMALAATSAGSNASETPRASIVHCAALVAFQAIFFVPMIGHGFVLDDFGHLFVASQESVRFGLTHASGGPFYAPLAWLTFEIDWLCCGARPFPWAVTNLGIHTANVLLVYMLALRLWKSRAAACWTAAGFATLFPANVAAVLWIATRAHVLATFFVLTAMLASLRFVRSETARTAPAAAIVGSSALAMLAKENGTVALAAVTLAIWYEQRSSGRRIAPPTLAKLCAGLVAALGLYLALRSRADAVPIRFADESAYDFVPSLAVPLANVATYAWRTYGRLSLVALAMLAAELPRGRGVSWNRIDRRAVALSLALFLAALAPVMLIRHTPRWRRLGRRKTRRGAGGPTDRTIGAVRNSGVARRR